MNQRLDKYLVKKCPTLFADRNASMQTTCMCWGFECGDGWYQLLKEACFKLEPIMASLKEKDPEGWWHGFYRASQIKEKYGTLRFYLAGNTPTTDKIIERAERRSAKTCDVCGKPGKLTGSGWYATRCKRHAHS